MAANNKTYKTGELAKIQTTNNEQVANLETKRLEVAQEFKAQKKFAVVGAPMYQAYFGSKMLIDINGIPLYVPLDGRTYEIPESYAEVFQTRLRDINDQINMQKRLGGIQDNIESYPGELDLVKPV